MDQIAVNDKKVPDPRRLRDNSPPLGFDRPRDFVSKFHKFGVPAIRKLRLEVILIPWLFLTTLLVIVLINLWLA
jgi:hypothetical protein